MNAGLALAKARRRAGLSQRALAAKTGVAQPTIARIERGHDDPRLQTLERLLNALGETVEALPRAGVGIDRTGIRELLALTPGERLASLAEEAETFNRISGARRVP
jgi:predicted transcriptional regulator